MTRFPCAAHALAAITCSFAYAQHTLVQCSFFVLYCTRVFVCAYEICYFHSCTMNGDEKIYDIGIGNIHCISYKYIYLLNIYMLFFPILLSWSFGRLLELSSLLQSAMSKFSSQFAVAFFAKWRPKNNICTYHHLLGFNEATNTATPSTPIRTRIVHTKSNK